LEIPPCCHQEQRQRARGERGKILSTRSKVFLTLGISLKPFGADKENDLMIRNQYIKIKFYTSKNANPPLCPIIQ
jgi:hypothetical protein